MQKFKDRLWIAATNLFWALVFGLFGLKSYHQLFIDPSHRIINAMLMMQGALLAVTFLVRRSTKNTSGNLVEILMSFLATFSFMLFEVVKTNRVGLVGLVIQAAGLSLTIYGTLSLSRSFGIIPANRGVRTTGLYRLVRHPIYFSYVIFYTGFILNNYSLHNTLVVALFALAQTYRIFAEERLLSQDPEYVTYKTKVRWRLIPFIW